VKILKVTIKKSELEMNNHQKKKGRKKARSETKGGKRG
jgi:hypothetical protein